MRSFIVLRVFLTSVFVLHKSLVVMCRKPANIILIVADDLGFNDVGFHGSEIYTPNLNLLARTGVVLENYYVSSSCTPSRSQLLTGRYGIHTGQRRNIQPMQPSCLSLDEVTIAQKLKAQRYKTHMVGKWHLGHYKVECTPTKRGFDSFTGILLGSGDHFRYYKKKRYRGLRHYGYDFWRNETVSRSEGIFREYSTNLYRDEAIRIISNHNPKDPLFLYLAFQAPHGPLQVPRKWLYVNSLIPNKDRRYLAGMVSALDSAVGDLVSKLKSHGLWDNTVLVFTTDNGGQILNGASNWPLRGSKGTFWEGGVRGVGFVNSPLIEYPGRKRHQLMHVSDWFPTFMHLSHGNMSGTKPLDGVNQWDMISRDSRARRREVLIGLLTAKVSLNIKAKRLHAACQKFYPKNLKKACMRKDGFWRRTCKVRNDMCVTYNGKKWCNRAAIRSGKWKLLVGIQKPGNWVQTAIRGGRTLCATEFDNSKRIQLYNIRRDPNETRDLAQRYPKKVNWLMAKLERYRKSSVPERWRAKDIRGSPLYNRGVWGPWKTSEETMA